MRPQQMFAAVCASILFLGLVPTAEAALLSRLSGQAYYDTDRNITWAADANINGFDNLANQVAWVSGLNIGGETGWRLPTTANPDASCSSNPYGTGCTGSEMGHLFNVEGISSAAPGPFSNVQATSYWSSTIAPNPSLAFIFDFGAGSQGVGNQGFGSALAWAVQDGDVPVSAIPVPSALLLMATGLVGLVAIRRWTSRIG